MQQTRLAGWEETSDIILFATDFVDKPEILSDIFQRDFQFSPMNAHIMRRATLHMLDLSGKEVKNSAMMPIAIAPTDDLDKNYSFMMSKGKYQKVSIRKNSIKFPTGERFYGLQDSLPSFPLLQKELNDFFLFMTEPNLRSQEIPIRAATANVYLRHSHLFLGWLMRSQKLSQNIPHSEINLHLIFPNNELECATVIFDFLKWLKVHRKISSAYEANILRGLIKLSKFRYARDSVADVTYGGKSYDDIPVVRELRKLHREAYKLAVKSPRVSDEALKWLGWKEYLSVVRFLREDLDRMLQDARDKVYDEKLKRRVAVKYQTYLLLAFFANIPDRQRTFRELVIGKNFYRSEEIPCNYFVKHGPDDYKTGKTYGNRPPLVLSADLTEAIDDFIKNWRPALSPKSDHLFLQHRSGNPMTENSVYHIVSTTCFSLTGKKTNPHLLRDMVVTYVRETDASERELEALALYMGHSIQMQRTSYDRRTISQKVAPAINLLQSISKGNEFAEER
jgi:hypothetical protein